MIIEKINIAQLSPAKYNPRKDLKPGDAEYEKLKRSVEEFGCVEPIIWNKRTGNIVGVATAIAAGGPGALFWMEVAALFGMATKYAEGLLAVKYRVVDEDNHALGGPFYYIEQ